MKFWKRKNDFPVPNTPVMVNYSVSQPQPPTSLNTGGIKSDMTWTMEQVNSVFSEHGAVSGRKAMKLSDVYACIQDVAESIGALPVKVYRKGDNGREEITSDRLHRIFSVAPNDYMTSQQFNEMAAACCKLYGAFYAYPVYNDRGNLMEIIPFKDQGFLRPSMDQDGNVYMYYSFNDGRPGHMYEYDKLFKIIGFTLDGFTPIRPLEYQAQLFNTANSQSDNHNALQKNGIRSQMALASEHTFANADALQRLREQWNEFRGPAGVGKTPILENGFKPVPLNLTASELELLEMQQFTTEKICNVFRVPLYRIRHNKDVTNDKKFDLDESYMRDCLTPIKVKLDKEFTRFTPRDIIVELDEHAFYQGSPWRLAEKIDKLVRGGLMTVNEGRKRIGLEPIPGGDVFVVQSNNAIYGQWQELPDIREQINGQGNNNLRGSENENQE